ncbi:MAG: tryptophan--tRNA ligase, partial [Parcubacteria group bacterium]|nr:tryptophan--tRNA ligase [Parcubacteria group bacterium]
MKGKKYLTGDRPTGPLHLGHYVGSLKNRVDLQNDGCEGFIIIADYQVVTDRFETEDVEKNIYELVKDYISVGIDPKKTPIFVQSQIPELAELTMVLSMLVTVPQLERNPTVKEEAKAMGVSKKMSAGMFVYPVSQAADILLLKADFVPVGEDQAPHIELTRDVANRFNKTFGEVFPVPKIVLSDYPRLLGLDGNQKMSKSRGNAINLSDDAKTVEKKLKKAVTDSKGKVAYDPKEQPEVSNLLTMMAIVTGKSEKDLVKNFKGKGYGVLKTEVADAVNAFLDPIRKKRAKVTDAQVKKILKDGAARV